MSRVYVIITFALFLINCESTPIGNELNGQEEVSQAKVSNQPTTNCLTNNQSQECSLLLESISFELPELRCDPYEHVIDVETSFFTPAGLGDGSTSRIDWEFLPNGNAGFWVSNIEEPVEPNSFGTVTMTGCFSFGEQTTLRVARTITDQLGNESNVLTLDIEDPSPSKIRSGSYSEFEFQTIAIATD